MEVRTDETNSARVRRTRARRFIAVTWAAVTRQDPTVLPPPGLFSPTSAPQLLQSVADAHRASHCSRNRGSCGVLGWTETHLAGAVRSLWGVVVESPWSGSVQIKECGERRGPPASPQMNRCQCAHHIASFVNDWLPRCTAILSAPAPTTQQPALFGDDLAATQWGDRLLASVIRAECLPISQVPRMLVLCDQLAHAMLRLCFAQYFDLVWDNGVQCKRKLTTQRAQTWLQMDKKQLRAWMDALHMVRLRVHIGLLLTFDGLPSRDPVRRATQHMRFRSSLLQMLQLAAAPQIRSAGTECRDACFHSMVRVAPDAVFTRDSADVSGWIYAMVFPFSKGLYIGSTSRTGRQVRSTRAQNPFQRFQEHRSSAIRFRNSDQGANAIPMYRHITAAGYQVCDCLFLPLMAVVQADSDTASPVRLVRNLERVIQVHRSPGLVAPWCKPQVAHGVSRREAIQRVGGALRVPRTGGPYRQHGRAAEPDLCRRLLRCADGTPWHPGAQYHRQFLPGEVQFHSEHWEVATCCQVVTQLLHHADRARRLYPLLRRLPADAVSQLLYFAFRSGSAAQEETVWRHLRSAGNPVLYRVPRLVIRDVRTQRSSVRRMLQPLIEHLKSEACPLVVKWIPSMDRPISHYLSNETSWQRRLQHTDRGKVRCSCQQLTNTLGAWADCIRQSVGREEQHFLVRWADLMQPRREPPGFQSRWGAWRARLAAALGMDQMATLPVNWKTPVSCSVGKVIESACDAGVRLIHATLRMQHAVVGTRGRRALLLALREWLYAENREELQQATRPDFHVQLLSECPLLEFQIGVLDKMASDARVCCPRLGIAETTTDLHNFFEDLGPSVGESMDQQLESWRREIALVVRGPWVAGLAMPDVSGDSTQTARSLPKGKAPESKSRLVIGCHRLPTAQLHKLACRGTEGLLDIFFQQTPTVVDYSVASLGDVVRNLSTTAMQVLREAEGTVLSITKNDFVNFFFQVPRSEARRSLAQLISYVKRTAARRTHLKVRRSSAARNQPRVIKGPWKTQTTRLAAGADCPADEVIFRMDRALEAALDLDFGNLLVAFRRCFRQVRGLTIGSSWGGTGCRCWSSMREIRAGTGWKALARRDAQWSDVHHDRPILCHHKLRWVDDRWVAIRSYTVAGAAAAKSFECLMYTGVNTMVSVLLATWLGPLAEKGCGFGAVPETALRVAAMLSAGGVTQTAEHPDTVVGFDVRLWHSGQLWIPSELMRLPSMEACAILTRLTTKEQELLSAMPEPCRGLLRPRVVDSRVDVRPTKVREDALVQWWCRLADSCFVSCPGDWPREVVEWQARPWQWFCRELHIAGWSKGVPRRALHRAVVSSLAGSGGCAWRKKRCAVLQWAAMHFRAWWELGCSTESICDAAHSCSEP